MSNQKGLPPSTTLAEAPALSESCEGLSSSRRALLPGEWACVDAKCAHVNVEKRSTCEKCGSAKPRVKSKAGKEIGKEAAEKSKGLFSAEDWVCSKCGNVNWARRNMCNICNAPRVSETEIRTGYGGGYMDRQVVEYKERADDDEEFDEFGRKKRSRRQQREANEQRDTEIEADTGAFQDEMEMEEWREKAPEKGETRGSEDERRDKGREEEDEDSESEDDEDDGDTAKYDLLADPELAAFKFNVAKPGVNGSTRDGAVPSKEASCSECSCSCSGGECSCPESDDEVGAKRSKLEPPSSKEGERSNRDEFRREKDRGRDRREDEHRSSRNRPREDRSRDVHQRNGSTERHRHSHRRREEEERESTRRRSGSRERRGHSRERERHHYHRR